MPNWDQEIGQYLAIPVSVFHCLLTQNGSILVVRIHSIQQYLSPYSTNLKHYIHQTRTNTFILSSSSQFILRRREDVAVVWNGIQWSESHLTLVVRE